MSENARIVREFVQAWSRLDPAELAGYFTEDGVYHNMPLDPVAGRETVQQFITGFVADWEWTEWEIVSLAADGDRVLCERVDRIRAKQGSVELPCVGVFELRDGKIAVWRDYFDLGTYMKAMGA